MTANNIFIPKIRVVHPTVIATEIVGVQPMTGPVGQIFTTDMRILYHQHPRYKFSRQWHIQRIHRYSDADEVYQWCEKAFGPHPKNPDAWCRWYRYSTKKFYFRDEQDAMFFVLRWS